MKSIDNISVIIPAAGKSTRMGQPKLVLPFRSTTIIGQIINSISLSGIKDIIIVINPHNIKLKDHLEKLKETYPIRVINNLAMDEGNMLTSIQLGLRSVQKQCKAAMIALGDQPQIQPDTIKKIINEFIQNKPMLIAPSYNFHRGHPWLISSPLFNEFLMIEPTSSAREFLKKNSSMIHYVEIDNESILKDIDTPQEYHRSLPDIGKNDE
jgi:molybdenum cofactor cytidylyltransferase